MISARDGGMKHKYAPNLMREKPNKIQSQLKECITLSDKPNCWRVEQEYYVRAAVSICQYLFSVFLKVS